MSSNTAGWVMFISMFYPIWGLALLALLSQRLSRSLQPLLGRVAGSAVTAAICGPLFTPIIIGTEGFALIAPWPAGFVIGFYSKGVTVSLPLGAAAAMISFLIALLTKDPDAQPGVPADAPALRAGVPSGASRPRRR